MSTPPNVIPSMRDWYQRAVVEPQQQAQALRNETYMRQRRERRRLPVVRTACTPDELAAIQAICPGNVTYTPGIGTKRFARQIQGAASLTAAQRTYLWGVVWKFRRQIADQRLIRMAKDKMERMDRNGTERNF